MAFKYVFLAALVAVAHAGLYNAPAPPKPAMDDEFDANPQYTFNYAVSDASTGDNHRQEETRDGNTVKGSYSLLEADGRTRIVEYTADEQNGFNAVVRHEGTAAVAAPVKIVAPAPVVKVVAPAPIVKVVAPVATKIAYAAPVAQYVHAAPIASHYSAPIAQYVHAAPISSHYASPISSHYASPIASHYASPIASHYSAPIASHYSAPIATHYASHNLVNAQYTAPYPYATYVH